MVDSSSASIQRLQIDKYSQYFQRHHQKYHPPLIPLICPFSPFPAFYPPLHSIRTTPNLRRLPPPLRGDKRPDFASQTTHLPPKSNWLRLRRRRIQSRTPLISQIPRPRTMGHGTKSPIQLLHISLVCQYDQSECMEEEQEFQYFCSETALWGGGRYGSFGCRIFDFTRYTPSRMNPRFLVGLSFISPFSRGCVFWCLVFGGRTDIRDFTWAIVAEDAVYSVLVLLGSNSHCDVTHIK
jgi:hypothetical protein